jgi:uncharacterized protein YggT (Ycf19 family)
MIVKVHVLYINIYIYIVYIYIYIYINSNQDLGNYMYVLFKTSEGVFYHI